MTTNKVIQQIVTLEDYMLNPLDGVEWVDGQLIEKHQTQWIDEKLLEKPTLTAKTRRIQSKLNYYWRSYMMSRDLLSMEPTGSSGVNAFRKESSDSCRLLVV